MLQFESSLLYHGRISLEHKFISQVVISQLLLLLHIAPYARQELYDGARVIRRPSKDFPRISQHKYDYYCLSFVSQIKPYNLKGDRLSSLSK